MENFKGTKGRWKTVEREGDFHIDTEHEAVECLATIWDNTLEVSRHNAQLIAAAPDLLDALIKCERVLNNMADKLSEVGLQYHVQAVQAINKALGE
jgi:hypothetical protein